jgi:NAD(P)-dependent dehydrogenase (short-subunit alcohol dehydrogenase family)
MSHYQVLLGDRQAQYETGRQSVKGLLASTLVVWQLLGPTHVATQEKIRCPAVLHNTRAVEPSVTSALAHCADRYTRGALLESFWYDGRLRMSAGFGFPLAGIQFRSLATCHMRSVAMASTEKVALITGANKGIGFETARGLGELGIAIVLGSRDEARGRAAVESLRKKGIEKVEGVCFDVTRPDDHREIARHLEKNFGKLDILVNNAGVMLDKAEFEGEGGFNTTSTVAIDVLRKTFETNFFAVVALTQTLLPLIRKSPAGRIVNLSSILGSLKFHADPTSPIYAMKAFAYDASKTALNAFTVHLAHELQDTPIKVNSAHPGWVKTDMGGPAAPMELSEGGQTSVQLATLPDDGPTGGFFHLGKPIPW